VFVVSVALHLGEAWYARRLAGGARGWFLQTLVLGYPSLRLLRRRRTLAAARARDV
jgi:hypothetical protein